MTLTSRTELLSPCALLLDLDGTLADSLPVMRQVYDAFLLSLEAIGSDQEFSHLNGPPLAEVVEFLAASHGLPGSQAELLQRYNEIADRAYGEVQPTHGALGLLEAAQLARCKVGVVTSNAVLRASRWVESSGLSALVDFVVGAEDVKLGKPHPEAYQLALARTGCPVDRVVAVEDSPKGAASARAAGLYTFALVPQVDVRSVGTSRRPSDEWPDDVMPIESLSALTVRLWAPRALKPTPKD